MEEKLVPAAVSCEPEQDEIDILLNTPKRTKGMGIRGYVEDGSHLLGKNLDVNA